ncbi:hypothetical protein DLM75_05405 [Leptospira stimsonii]|uniref:Uncharacterized protein n=1 Tax=Leptospira stimsonii TaxID=2202203 RepID=A0A396ZFU3_9LEPT|nr:hypothetical protein DLM75_05405 [Leptospira stimsonii]
MICSLFYRSFLFSRLSQIENRRKTETVLSFFRKFIEESQKKKIQFLLNDGAFSKERTSRRTIPIHSNAPYYMEGIKL